MNNKIEMSYYVIALFSFITFLLEMPKGVDNGTLAVFYYYCVYVCVCLLATSLCKQSINNLSICYNIHQTNV